MGVVRTKDGVTFARIAPGGFEILSALVTVAGMQTADLEVTCGTEGHTSPDPHVRGEAYDLSIAGLDGDQILALCQRLAATLGFKFTVLYEVPSLGQSLAPSGGQSNPHLYVNAGATAPHIHLQVKIGQTYP